MLDDAGSGSGAVAGSPEWARRVIKERLREAEASRTASEPFQEFPLSGDALVVAPDPNGDAIKAAMGRLTQQYSEALEAIKNGTYGVCEDCGKPIERERIMACPEATRCYLCQRRREAMGFR